jgi:outer membrane protein
LNNKVNSFYLKEVWAMFATMTKKLVWVAALVGLAVATNAHAEAKVAVVNFQRIFQESPQYSLISQLIQTEFAPRRRDLEQKVKDFQAKQEKLQRDSAVMSEFERTSLEKDLGKMQRDLKSQDEALKEDLEVRQNEETNKLTSQLVGEIHNYAKANGYDIVLSGNGVVLYVNDTYDITTQVLTYLKGRTPDTKPAATTKPATPAPATKPAK